MSFSKKHKKRLKFWFLKLPIFIGILCAVMIGALKLVERYPAPLKEGFEKYLSEKTNTNTTVGQLDKAAFFPNIDIRLKNMTMHRKNNAAIIDMAAQKFYISVPLSGLFVQQGRINLLDIENLQAEPDIFTPYAFNIQKASIVDKQGPEQYGSFIIAEGMYAQKQFFFEAEIQKDDRSYLMPDGLSFSLRLGAYEFNAATQKKGNLVILSNAIFQKDNKKAAARDYILVEKNSYKTDNPLACLYLKAGDNLQNCDQYLESEN